jgi:hypothetical protein
MKQTWMPFLVLPLVASAMLTTVSAQTAATPPQFQQFSVSRIYRGTPAAVNLNSNPDARRFRTALRDGAKKGPNFAGHYTVVTFGCGTSCQSLAIVDARTGAVYMTQVTADVGAKFQINSQLLVVNPPENITRADPPSVTPRYYVWQNNRLRQIYPPKSDRATSIST